MEKRTQQGKLTNLEQTEADGQKQSAGDNQYHQRYTPDKVVDYIQSLIDRSPHGIRSLSYSLLQQIFGRRCLSDAMLRYAMLCVRKAFRNERRDLESLVKIERAVCRTGLFAGKTKYPLRRQISFKA